MIIHHEPFRVRFCECDAYGHLNNVNYLRWMQEAAFAASAAVGYDFSRYDELAHLWLVRETGIEYLLPLAYNDEVRVKTWVSDFRRSHSLRQYEFIHARSGQVAARASTDWVYVDAQALRPAAIPLEMQQAFYPDRPPEDPPRQHFPAAPPPPPGVFSIRRRIEWRDIDMMWHVNNAVYLTYIEDAGVHVAEAHGWPMARMSEAGFALFARHHRIEYRIPAKLGDEIEISTWISDVQRSTAVRHYAIRRAGDGALLARVRTRWAWVDLKSGRPVRVPEAFLADFADNLSPETHRAGDLRG
ncbi:MAG: acyl-CoA thioesterase [Chloroflexota bacterium]